jgi:uncharacterized protein YutE (UPF0331/DUF86 family)
MNDILTNKIQSIQRCIERAREEYHKAGASFRSDYTSQDAAVLNVTRACEMTIDLANHIIKKGKLGIPTSSAESFYLLARKNIISHEMEEKMKGMVNFRNVAVHEYRKLDIDIVEKVILSGLDDLLEFSRILSNR